ncbi:YybH family protein [Spirosoma sp. KUDC1026]|uniref:YybH family protein n=1 Tax=Spirosoma sp. KUDC1026 TaxID=2745947 RepID=UPI00159BA3D0|nr:nuclear transport factor 2 family protein [Spirosoma sp. KUDC1026]QKZ12577.1 nuclear transport factor 2 family protein [Spirosoma sp. KUDC1026]
MESKQQIEQVVRQQERAVQQKDIDGAMANYATDVVSFDVVNTLQKVGLNESRQRLESWLSQFPGPFSYTVDNLEISVTDELAFCHSFNHVKGQLASGDEIDMRWRATICFRKQDNAWLITHEHSSVPFDPETGKALILLDR